MKELYENQLDEISHIDSNMEKCNAFFSILRSISQTVVVVCLDIAVEKFEEDETINNYLLRIQKPSDGLPYEILEYLVPVFRTHVDERFMSGWFEKDFNGVSLAKECNEIVEFRNSTSAHGVLDYLKSEKWANKLEKAAHKALEVFDDALPSKENRLRIIDNYKVSIPLTYNNLPFVINSIRNRKGLWKLKGQTLSITKSEDFILDLSCTDLFDIQPYISDRGYKLIEINNNRKDVVLHNIPIRQTDTFEGRESELIALNDWYNDEDSRVCLIFGDGGYGKTTFILESLNKFLEGDICINRKVPLYICYYSAKMTKWTEEGLTYFKSSQPIIDDCVREVVKIQENLSQDWYRLEGKALVDKARTFLEGNKILRDDVLLIIDNTETMTNLSNETRELAETIKYISRNIARVVITSRRREFLEAQPIAIKGLQEAESVDLIRSLSVQHNVIAINQAGETRLRKVVKKLMNKPLLIEAYVKYMKRSDSSIDEGLDKFYKVSNEEILNFLYEDAWIRMNELQRLVFLVAIKLECEIDNRVLNEICQLVEINIDEFTKAYEETYFAEIIDYASGYSFEIVSLSRFFFNKKLLSYSKEEQSEIENIAAKVMDYSNKMKETELSYRTDRVSEAFRSEFAKLAKIHNDNNEIDEAVEMYELAIKDDPINAYLHDRYAWLLINRTENFPRALELSKKAYELDRNNIDAVVSIALSFYKLHNLDEGDKYIDISVEKGRSGSFGFLRKGIARYQIAKKTTNHDRKKMLYANAIKYLKNSQDSLKGKPVASYEAKMKKDASRYLEFSLKEHNILRLK